MKKKVILVLLIFLSATSFSQHKDSTITSTKADYLRKSNNQKTIARLLTASAIAISIGALAHDLNNVLTDEPGSTGLYITSAAMLSGGIILFTASSKNRKRAESVSFSINIENAPVWQQTVVCKKRFPAVELSVHLK